MPLIMLLDADKFKRIKFKEKARIALIFKIEISATGIEPIALQQPIVQRPWCSCD